MHEIPSKDWDTIITLLQSHTAKDLSLLFFPTMDAFSDGSLNKKFLQLPPSMTSNMLPVLETFKFKTDTFTTRRPEFLECLDDTDYCQVFKTISDNPAIKLPSWREFSRLQTEVSSITTQILHHIMMWYDQTWEFPKKADDRRKNFQWSLEFEQVVLRKSALIDGGARGYSGDADLESVAHTTTHKIWDIVEKNMTWKQKNVIAEVSVFLISYTHISNNYSTRWSKSQNHLLGQRPSR